MKAFLVLFLVCSLPTLAGTAPQKGEAWKGLVPTYELYSWEGPPGSWNFSLMFTTDRQKTVTEVFNEETTLHGVEQLKRKISKLPRPSTIVWFDRLTWAGVRLKGSEGLKYPPKEILDEVTRYAAARKIKVFGPRG